MDVYKGFFGYLIWFDVQCSAVRANLVSLLYLRDRRNRIQRLVGLICRLRVGSEAPLRRRRVRMNNGNLESF